MAALKVFHHQSQKKWDNDLQLLAFAFNTACHESTNVCPTRMFLGAELATPLSLESVGYDSGGRLQRFEKWNGFWAEIIWNLRKAKEDVDRR